MKLGFAGERSSTAPLANGKLAGAPETISIIPLTFYTGSFLYSADANLQQQISSVMRARSAKRSARL